MADVRNRGIFGNPVSGVVYSSSLFYSKFSSEGDTVGGADCRGGGLRQNASISGISAFDLPDERHPESIYVSWSGAQMY